MPVYNCPKKTIRCPKGNMIMAFINDYKKNNIIM